MRFYISPDSILLEKNLIEINDRKEIHHIRDVMRLKKDTGITLFDGKGKEYSGVIKSIDRNSIIIEIDNVKEFKNTLPYRTTLYQAIPKKTKMDFIIEKTVELGVDKIAPIITERTEFSNLKEISQKRLERWRNIAKSASKQCGRVELPLILDVLDFEHALVKAKDSDLVIFAALDKSSKMLRDILKEKTPRDIAIFIGPEGDFTPQEISKAKEHVKGICSLGRLVLRVETGALYILSCLNYTYAY